MKNIKIVILCYLKIAFILPTSLNIDLLHFTVHGAMLQTILFYSLSCEWRFLAGSAARFIERCHFNMNFTHAQKCMHGLLTANHAYRFITDKDQQQRMLATFQNWGGVFCIPHRCVAEQQRTLALDLGVQSLVFRALGSIPGPIVFGVIFDSTCLFRRFDCGRRGNCWVYDNL